MNSYNETKNYDSTHNNGTSINSNSTYSPEESKMVTSLGLVNGAIYGAAASMGFIFLYALHKAYSALKEGQPSIAVTIPDSALSGKSIGATASGDIITEKPSTSVNRAAVTAGLENDIEMVQLP